MKQKEILNCISNPDRLKEIPFEQLKQALIDYPYSQNLHFLLAQKSMQEQHPDFERHLKIAATYMNSRSFLRKQLQQNDRPSQPIVEPEPEAEPAQGNTSINIIASENLLVNLPDEELPPVEFIPDTRVDEHIPNHVADIATDTPPADLPPPTETSVRSRNIDPIPPIISEITPITNQVEDPEVAPVEKKIVAKDEPIAEQPRIIHERMIITDAESEAPTPSGSNLTDLSEPEQAEISGTDLELDDKVSDNVAPDASKSEDVEIIEFPKQFDFDDEMDDLLSKPLIEVIPEKFAKDDIEDESALEEEEDSISDLLVEEFDERVFSEDLEHMDEEALTLEPKMDKWMKKYQEATDKKKKKKRSKKKDKGEIVKVKSQKAKKKTKKKEATLKTDVKDNLPTSKTEKAEKTAKKKGSSTKKKKKKDSNQKISKKKAIRKFANRSIVENGETISITLADLYAKQGKTEKAILAYERLSLIIPEKKAFFASLIKKLKKK